MARLTRLTVGGQGHLVLLRAHSGQRVFSDDADRSSFMSALQAACGAEGVALHAYSLLQDRVWLLCTPAGARALGRAIQALGRSFSTSLNRRHGRRGSVWDGRYRSAVIEGGGQLLQAMVFVEQAPVRAGLSSAPTATPWSSARHHVGSNSEWTLTDAPAYWSLGNTPFERCMAYRALLDEPQDDTRVDRITRAVLGGWALGSAAYLEALGQRTARPLAPKPRGRPRKRSPAL